MKRLSLFLLSSSSLVFAFACAQPIGGPSDGPGELEEPGPDPAPIERQLPTPNGAQGVQGAVEKREGNFQPCITPCTISGTTTPLSVPVHIFRGEHMVTTKLDPKDPTLVKSVKSDAAGVYSAELAPGEYTVVAEIDGELYLNSGSPTKANVWSTIIVTSGAWTRSDIADSSHAAY